MQALFEIIVPVFLVVGFGYVVAWKGLFSESAVDGLVAFTQNFAIPCLLFSAISRIELGAIANIPLIFCYYFGAFLSFFLGYAGARIFFERNSTDAVAIGFCCFFSNTLLLGLPITERAYGSDALVGNFAIIAFHAPLLYFLGVTAMEVFNNQRASLAEKASRVFRAMFRNPFVISIAPRSCRKYYVFAASQRLHQEHRPDCGGRLAGCPLRPWGDSGSVQTRRRHQNYPDGLRDLACRTSRDCFCGGHGTGTRSGLNAFSSSDCGDGAGRKHLFVRKYVWGRASGCSGFGIARDGRFHRIYWFLAAGSAMRQPTYTTPSALNTR